MTPPPAFKYINKLQNKNILIFGGSSGFGFGIAEAALENGANVTISGSNHEKLERAAQRLRTTYHDHLRDEQQQIRTAVCNLSDLDTLPDRLEYLLAEVTTNGENKLDHVIYTADNAYAVPDFAKTELKDIHGSFTLQIYAATILARVLATTPHLYHSTTSSFTLTNGISGHKPVKGWTVPAMAATALEGLVRGLAIDMAPVRVNLVSAGIVNTELIAQIPRKVLELYEKETVAKRIGEVEDVVEQYLAAMRDGNVTGSVLVSDGGRRIA